MFRGGTFDGSASSPLMKNVDGGCCFNISFIQPYMQEMARVAGVKNSAVKKYKKTLGHKVSSEFDIKSIFSSNMST